MGGPQLRSAGRPRRSSKRRSSNAARTRATYLNSGDETTLAPYKGLKTEIHHDVTQIRELVRDNPSQAAMGEQLNDNLLRRLELLDAAIEMRRKLGHSTNVPNFVSAAKI